ncbi:hypothetical protein ABIB82_007593, partial [Bradyrhizobium sp. i1.8.4]
MVPVLCATARSMLAARTKLVNLRRDIDNQMRGLCKGLGIVIGKAGSTNLACKVDAVLAEAPHKTFSHR